MNSEGCVCVFVFVRASERNLERGEGLILYLVRDTLSCTRVEVTVWFKACVCLCACMQVIQRVLVSMHTYTHTRVSCGDDTDMSGAALTALV